MLRTKNQLFLLFFLIFLNAKSQNLVPNPSFENATGDPPCHVVQTKEEFSNNMQNWIMPTTGTSDIYSTDCMYLTIGQQAPRTGNIMCAFITYGAFSSFSYREYLQVQLTHPLIIGKKYYAEMYVSLADLSTYACNNIGMAFSDKQISSTDAGVIPFTPQIKSLNIITDTVNWFKISGIFTATSAARYLTIGNFNDDVSTASTTLNTSNLFSYYYIDDVFVELVCDPKDDSTTICKGSSITLDLNDTHVTGWSLASDPNTIVSNTNTVVVSPQITTSYIAHYDCDTTSIFKVIVDPVPTSPLGKDTTICKGETISYDATTENATYLWQDGSTNPNYVITKTGKYTVTISNGCKKIQDEIFIRVVKPSTFNFGSDTTICAGEIMQFDATTDGARYLWQDGSTHPIYTVQYPGSYAVSIKNSCGVFNNNITLNLCCEGAKIPNLITPNGDGQNETFYIDCFGNGDYELEIYNTWGSMIYNNPAYLNNWGGDNVSDGLYYFAIKFKNTTINTGWVQVIR